MEIYLGPMMTGQGRCCAAILRNADIRLPQYDKNMDSCVILLENNVLHANLMFYMIPMISVKIQAFAPACKNSSNFNTFP